MTNSIRRCVDGHKQLLSNNWLQKFENSDGLTLLYFNRCTENSQDLLNREQRGCYNEAVEKNYFNHLS